MHEGLAIRRAVIHDVPALIAICAEHAAYERLPHDAEARASMLAAALDGPSPRLLAWLACQDGEMVGYASATFDFSTLDRATYLHMDALYVRARWRGQGIGQVLWETVRDGGTHAGCFAMQWQTPAWNEGAARFYRKLGASEHAKLRYVLPLSGA